MDTYKRLLRFAAPYRGRLAAAMACNLLAALFATVSIGLVAPVIDLIFSKTPVGLTQYLSKPSPALLKFLPAGLAAANPVITPQQALFWVPLLIAGAVFFKG